MSTLFTLMSALVQRHPVANPQFTQQYAQTFCNVLDKNADQLHSVQAQFDGEDAVITVQSSNEACLNINDGLKYQLAPFFVNNVLKLEAQEGRVTYRMSRVRQALDPKSDLYCRLHFGFNALAA